MDAAEDNRGRYFRESLLLHSIQYTLVSLRDIQEEEESIHWDANGDANGDANEGDEDNQVEADRDGDGIHEEVVVHHSGVRQDIHKVDSELHILEVEDGSL